MAKTEKFLCLYDEVFEADGSVKACGRAKCRELIIECQAIAPNADPNYYGTTEDPDDGWMKVANIKALYEKIVKKEDM